MFPFSNNIRIVRTENSIILDNNITLQLLVDSAYFDSLGTFYPYDTTINNPWYPFITAYINAMAITLGIPSSSISIISITPSTPIAPRLFQFNSSSNIQTIIKVTSTITDHNVYPRDHLSTTDNLTSFFNTFSSAYSIFDTDPTHSTVFSIDTSFVPEFYKTPINCAVSDWEDWNTCSFSCGNNGNQTRTRKIEIPPINNGQKCPILYETKPCNIFTCDNFLTNGSPFPTKLYVQNNSTFTLTTFQFNDSSGNVYVYDDEDLSGWKPATFFCFDFTDDPIPSYGNFSLYAGYLDEEQNYIDVLIVNFINYNSTLYIEYLFDTVPSDVIAYSSISGSEIVYTFYPEDGEVTQFGIHCDPSGQNCLDDNIQSGQYDSSGFPTTIDLYNNSDAIVLKNSMEDLSDNLINIIYYYISSDDYTYDVYKKEGLDGNEFYFLPNKKESNTSNFSLLPGECLRIKNLIIPLNRYIQIYMLDNYSIGYYITIHNINNQIITTYNCDSYAIDATTFPIYRYSSVDVNNIPQSMVNPEVVDESLYNVNQSLVDPGLIDVTQHTIHPKNTVMGTCATNACQSSLFRTGCPEGKKCDVLNGSCMCIVCTSGQICRAQNLPIAQISNIRYSTTIISIENYFINTRIAIKNFINKIMGTMYGEDPKLSTYTITNNNYNATYKYVLTPYITEAKILSYVVVTPVINNNGIFTFSVTYNDPKDIWLTVEKDPPTASYVSTILTRTNNGPNSWNFTIATNPITVKNSIANQIIILIKIKRYQSTKTFQSTENIFPTNNPLYLYAGTINTNPLSYNMSYVDPTTKLPLNNEIVNWPSFVTINTTIPFGRIPNPQLWNITTKTTNNNNLSTSIITFSTNDTTQVQVTPIQILSSGSYQVTTSIGTITKNGNNDREYTLTIPITNNPTLKNVVITCYLRNNATNPQNPVPCTKTISILY